MNLKKMMKQAQEMQKKFEKEMSAVTVEGSAGGGMVTVVMKGTKDVASVRIAPEVVNPDDVEMLQDLIIAALSDASHKVDEALQERLGGLGSALGLPGI